MHQKRRINNKQLCVSSNIVCVVSCLWLFTLYTNLIATEIKCDCYRNIFCILRNQIIAPAINLIAQSRQMISIAIKHDYNQNNNFRNFLCNAAHAHIPSDREDNRRDTERGRSAPDLYFQESRSSSIILETFLRLCNGWTVDGIYL
eukprot:88106_1